MKSRATKQCHSHKKFEIFKYFIECHLKAKIVKFKLVRFTGFKNDPVFLFNITSIHLV